MARSNSLHGPPKESKFLRREGLKSLLPYIRAVCAVGTAAHDGYSRLGFLPPPCTQGTGNLSECPQPGLTFVPSLRFLQAPLQNGVNGSSPGCRSTGAADQIALTGSSGCHLTWSNAAPLARTAHAVRAILLANATTTTL